MASIPIASAPQPELRAFIVYDRAPPHCVPFLITDHRTAPLLRPGDVALIDTADREPTVGELFVIGWEGGGSDLVEIYSRAGRFGSGPDGEIIDTHCWFVAPYNRPRGAKAWAKAYAAGGTVTGFSDGPYASEGPKAGYLRSKLIGRVVGLLEPGLAEAVRRIR